MSSCNAVIVPPASCPLNRISLLFVSDLITKSEVSRLNLPKSVPSSLNIISAPFASIVISPSTSRVKLPDDISSSEVVSVALPTTKDVLLCTAPPTAVSPLTPNLCVILVVPLTSSKALGVSVPIPTLPVKPLLTM